MPDRVPQKLPVPPDTLEGRKQHWDDVGKRLGQLNEELVARHKKDLIATPDVIERFDIQVLDPLDVDDELGLGDRHPRFFAPMNFRRAKKVTRRTRRKHLWEWRKPCRAPSAGRQLDGARALRPVF